MPADDQDTVQNAESQTPPAEGPGAGAATALATRPKTAPPRVDRLPPYKVLLHNDDVNDVISVIRTIVELTPLNQDEATLRTTEADKTGVALLLVTHKERAELYREQFRSKRLNVSIEPGE